MVFITDGDLVYFRSGKFESMSVHPGDHAAEPEPCPAFSATLVTGCSGICLFVITVVRSSPGNLLCIAPAEVLWTDWLHHGTLRVASMRVRCSRVC